MSTNIFHFETLDHGYAANIDTYAFDGVQDGYIVRDETGCEEHHDTLKEAFRAVREAMRNAAETAHENDDYAGSHEILRGRPWDC